MKNKIKNNLYLYFLLYIFLSVFIGFRYKIGGDWGGYSTDIDELNAFLKNHKIYEIFYGLTFQPHQGYHLLLYLSSFFTNKIYIVNFIAAMIFCAGLFRLSIKQPFPLLSIYISFCYFVVVHAMNFTKQSISLGLIMIALSLNNSRILKKFLIIFLAFIFHYYSIILAPFVFVEYFIKFYQHIKKYNKIINRFILYIFFTFIVLIYLNFAILILGISYFDRFYYFLEHLPIIGTIRGAFYYYVINPKFNHDIYSLTIRSSIMILIFLIFLFNLKYFKKFDDYYLNLFSLIFIVFLFLIHNFAPTAALRILVYFSFLHITVIGKLPNLFETYKSKIISILIISIFYMAIFFVWYYFSPRNAAFLNYRNILFL